MPRSNTKAQIAEAKRWQPFANGKYYGSTACCNAHLCTRKAFNQATKEANALAKRMGVGWVPRVWENLGWYYSVSKGPATINARWAGSNTAGGWKITGYSCDLFGIPNCEQYPEVAQIWFGYMATPELALGHAVKKARGIMALMETGLRQVSK